MLVLPLGAITKTAPANHLKLTRESDSMFIDSDDDTSSTFSGTVTCDDMAILTEGIHATVYKIEADEISQSHETAHETAAEAVPRAIKLVSAYKNACLEPHDIRSEAFILARLSHPGIIQLLEASYSRQQKIYRITMPFVRLTLSQLLENPRCSPYPRQPEQAPKETWPVAKELLTLVKSTLYQITAALAFLHSRMPKPIAHRDLKPSNVLVSPDGCIKLIDFGISWEEDCPRGRGASFQEALESQNRNNGRLSGLTDAPAPDWDETPIHMCCQVSSGSYRAPELLFAPRRYDARAIDMWSLGVLASGFFTSLVFEPKQLSLDPNEFDWDALVSESTTDSLDSARQPDPTVPFNAPSVGIVDMGGAWCRLPLFDCTRGEIGLIASIFQLLGTPNESTWPGFGSLPAASALIFKPLPPRSLRPLLPNLPPDHVEQDGVCLRVDNENVVSLVEGLVRYPPESRSKASELLHHNFFTRGLPLVLPLALSGSDIGVLDDSRILPGLVSQFSINE